MVLSTNTREFFLELFKNPTFVSNKSNLVSISLILISEKKNKFYLQEIPSLIRSGFFSHCGPPALLPGRALALLERAAAAVGQLPRARLNKAIAGLLLHISRACASEELVASVPTGHGPLAQQHGPPPAPLAPSPKSVHPDACAASCSVAFLFPSPHRPTHSSSTSP